MVGDGHSASDPCTAVTSVSRHAARVDLPPAGVDKVRGVYGEAALERRGARVAGVGPAHLPPDGRGRRLPRHEARRQLVGRREQLQHRALCRRGFGVHESISFLIWSN